MLRGQGIQQHTQGVQNATRNTLACASMLVLVFGKYRKCTSACRSLHDTVLKMQLNHITDRGVQSFELSDQVRAGGRIEKLALLVPQQGISRV